ncbi:MAG: hypothetical protein M0C28_32400 [Candidatus Moduliflexus flocculans]|nr:hypothetical protein [Candidatus Moduliflexus flocculans]
MGRRLGRGRGRRRARGRPRGPDGRVRPGLRRRAPCRPRSRRRPCSTSARSGPRPASGRPTAASSASRAASNNAGCCWGSCTHVWNYEQATAFLFGGLARSMRETEFLAGDRRPGPDELPRPPAASTGRREFGKAAADGQMGYDHEGLPRVEDVGRRRLARRLWPGPSSGPSRSAGSRAAGTPTGTGSWRAASTTRWTSSTTAPTRRWACGTSAPCGPPRRWPGGPATSRSPRSAARLFEKGRAWIDANLWNGEYYEHRVRPPKSVDDVAPSLVARHGRQGHHGARLPARPRAASSTSSSASTWPTSAASGYLVDPAHVRTTLASILKYNTRRGLLRPLQLPALVRAGRRDGACSWPATRRAGREIPSRTSPRS